MASRLENIAPEDIRQDPENPRSIFPEAGLAQLAESIERHGMQVPVVVHEHEDAYRLIDGDRRWQCSRRLGLEEIPALVVDEPDPRDRIVQMFNIHMVREEWQDMPTARALKQVMDDTGTTDPRALRDLLGLSLERIKRYKLALTLPPQYQELIQVEAGWLNFFWELDKNVLRALSRYRPELLDARSEELITEAFVDKRKSGVVTDIVSLRKVGAIIKLSAEEGASLDGTLEALFDNPDYSIESAYEESVMLTVEAGKLASQSAALVKGIQRLLERAASPEDRHMVRSVASNLRDELGTLLDSDEQ